MCALTLQGKEKVDFKFFNFWKDLRFYYGVSVVVVAVLFSLLSYGSIEGARPKWSEKENKVVTDLESIKGIIPWAFKKVGYDVFAYFREKSVSEKPDNYWEIGKEERLESVKGAKLKGSNLKNADMYLSFLVKADLRNAILKNAILRESNLIKANLTDANLQKANLFGASLEQSDLSYANLKEAELFSAYLQYAKLLFVNLQGANLNYADLEETSIFSANLKKTNLSEANFEKANINFSSLHEANFENTNLLQVDLSNTDLRMAKNLTIQQLSKVKTLYKAELDPELLEQVKKCCPQLLEKPKKEPDETD